MVNAFKDILRRERQSRGWSQQYVAEQIDIDEPNTVSRWERGKSFPQRSVQPQLCTLFGMTMEELGLYSRDEALPISASRLESVVPSTTLSIPFSPDRIENRFAIELPYEPRNPYKGLHAFREEDTGDFFGRDQLILDLIEQLRYILVRAEENSATVRLLAVIGPSGSGKSSVIHAGLLPLLRSNAIPGSQQWIYLPPMTPGKRPVEALATILNSAMPQGGFASIYDNLKEEAARGLLQIATQLASRSEKKVVLVIDQFEELFTQTGDEQVRQHLIELLVRASSEPAGAVLVILALRADFFDRPMHYSRLGKIIEQQHAGVFPLSVSELRNAIEKPVALADVQVTFDNDLVRDMLLDVQGQHGVLPLLQFTLNQLFARRDGCTLTRKAYDEIGGVKGALMQQAEETYGLLPSEEHRRMTRTLFLRLIYPGTSEQDTTRRCAALAEFTFTEREQTRIVQDVIEAFIAARLLVVDHKEEAIVEICHEVLIREWKRLIEWLHESRHDTYIQQTINKDAAFWQERNKRRDLLYRGSRLVEAQGWMQRNAPNELEYRFLRASVTRRRRIRISGIVGIVLVLFLLFPFVADLFGLRTFLTSPIPPGGWWVSPQANQVVHDVLNFEVYAYPGVLTEPAIAYVDFTMRYVGPYAWFTACHITTHTTDNKFKCTVNLRQIHAVPGTINLSFNVFDEVGNYTDAPNGVHHIIYVPSS